jgi:reverse gyrase
LEWMNLLFFWFSKKVKFNLNQALKSVEQKDTETVNQSIDEDRKMLVQVIESKSSFRNYFNRFF